jgi:hypothetical protein
MKNLEIRNVEIRNVEMKNVEIRNVELAIHQMSLINYFQRVPLSIN